jgi:hypothetical protein
MVWAGELPGKPIYQSVAITAKLQLRKAVPDVRETR